MLRFFLGHPVDIYKLWFSSKLFHVRNSGDLKFFLKIFLEFLKKKKNTLILKILKISENVNVRIIAKSIKFL